VSELSMKDTTWHAADDIRSLNHKTRHEIEYPSDVYDILGGLATLAQRLPQLLGQLDRYMAREAGGGRLGHDSARPDAAAEAVGGIRARLADASSRADDLAAMLSEAHSLASGLHAVRNPSIISNFRKER
jgi:hypothetical protein